MYKIKQFSFKNYNFIKGNFAIRFIALVVLLHGIFIIVGTLLSQVLLKRLFRTSFYSIDISLIVGLSLIYLSFLLQRRKRNAWFLTIIVYSIYLGANLENYNDIRLSFHHLSSLILVRTILLPIFLIALLIINKDKYVVKSDTQSFRSALKISAIVILVLLLYGVIGYRLLGESGFHQKISFVSAFHLTVDQFNITNNPLKPFDQKARFFIDSLFLTYLAALAYVVISFFKPIKDKFSSQRQMSLRFRDLLWSMHEARSEDFFKVWPEDKKYFFDSTLKGALAYRVNKGVALILGSPVGKKARFKQLINEFSYVCFGNDWKPAFIHCEESYMEMFKSLGFNSQKIGQEAVVDINHFLKNTIKDKYFRNILNRYNKANYSYKFLNPPHDRKILNELKNISDDWLNRGGHVERGFAMGYFSFDYMNLTKVLAAYDQEGKMMAFVNLIAPDFDKEEATYDLLRFRKEALGNVNDYLLIKLIEELKHSGYSRLNLGLCPLAGINKDIKSKEERSLIDGVLSFAYANGDRFYSFSGLYRFKNKYEPVWRDRYFFFKGGLGTFTRINTALMNVMRKIH